MTHFFIKESAYNIKTIYSTTIQELAHKQQFFESLKILVQFFKQQNLSTDDKIPLKRIYGNNTF